MTFAEFIQAHDADDLGKLALARGRFASSVPDFDLALTTLEVRRKLRDKVPEWYALPALQYPLRISGEQCSSTPTARYKADVALAAVLPASSADPVAPCPYRLADLTGGLGVDSWAFAQRFGQVLYNEMRPELASAAAHNFRELGLTNIHVRNCELVPAASAASQIDSASQAFGSSDSALPTGYTVAQVLDGFRPDIIFLDPARRSADGRKVFRLEDCQPDVLQLLPELLAACPRLLLKLSPMADITLCCKQLRNVSQVHVVAAEGECKELLLLLDRDHIGPARTLIYEDGAIMEIPSEDDNTIPVPGTSVPPLVPSAADLFGSLSATYLFEPGKALLKAGAFELPCRFGLTKLGRHTHLYIGQEVPDTLRPFGKVFEIQEVLPLDKKAIKDIGQRYPKADVTARNLPLTTDQLRKKLRVADGGPTHIFAVHIDSQNANYLLITLPIR